MDNQKSKTKRTEKISFVVSKEEKQFINECLAFYYTEGSPMSMSYLIKMLMFDDRNALFQDLRGATGNRTI